MTDADAILRQYLANGEMAQHNDDLLRPRPPAPPGRRPVLASELDKRQKLKTPPQAIKIILDGERPLSWNKYWSGMHWSKRSAEKDRVKTLVRHHLGDDVQMFAQPVEIRVRAFFKGNVQDCSNVCIKPYEDALIGWLIEDDSPQYVTAVHVESRKDNKRPRVEIEVVAV